MISQSLTLTHVSPAADGTAGVIRERHAFVRETDGSDERSSPHAPPVLLRQLNQNCKNNKRNAMKPVTKSVVTR